MASFAVEQSAARDALARRCVELRASVCEVNVQQLLSDDERDVRVALQEAAKRDTRVQQQCVELRVACKCVHSESGVLTLTCAELALLATMGEQQWLRCVVDALTALTMVGALVFPYKHLAMTSAAVDACVTALTRFDTGELWMQSHSDQPIPNVAFSNAARDLVHVGYSDATFVRRYQNASTPTLSFRSTDEHYERMDTVTDYFTEYQRMRAYRSDKRTSPYDMWHGDRVRVAELFHRVLSAAQRERRDTDAAAERVAVGVHELREAVYSVWNSECTQFKASLTLAVVERFRAERVLDMSAGWGDRLLGCLASRACKHYDAWDPNTGLKSGHSALKERVLAVLRDAGRTDKSEADFRVHYGPFEDAALDAVEPVDLVFSSPPFFDFEIYDGRDARQSTAQYPRLADWLVRFLFKCMHKAWQVLKPGGHMVLHITDVFRTKVCEAMCLFAGAELSASRYLGVIRVVGAVSGKARPMWVWRKGDGRDDAGGWPPPDAYRSALRSYNAELFSYYQRVFGGGDGPADTVPRGPLLAGRVGARNDAPTHVADHRRPADAGGWFGRDRDFRVDHRAGEWRAGENSRDGKWK